jgi:sialate O-acetylesterase
VGQAVTVRFAGQEHRAVADASGRWRVTLQPMPASSEPRTMTLESAGHTLTLERVLVGEVWVCSGQSNMQFAVGAALNPEVELQRADWPTIRLFTTPAVFSHEPQDDVEASWQPCTAATARYFSAVGFFFGRRLHEELDVPIGLIHSSWGGTRIELWTPLDALRRAAAGFPHLLQQVEQVEQVHRNLPALTQAYEQEMAKYGDALRELAAIHADPAEVQRWADPSLDDAAWPQMKVPLRWNLTRGVGSMEGMIWHRLAVTVPNAWAGRDLELRLGPIDAIDTTCFNGQKIGGLGSVELDDRSMARQPRVYQVPGSLVRAGRNVLAVGVTNLERVGGIHGGKAEDLRLVIKDEPTQSLPLAGSWKYQVRMTLRRPQPPVSSRLATALYNAKIHPVIPFGVRGVIWYQGESNAGRPDEYAALLEQMIHGWREAWGQPRLHFGIVQLANMGKPVLETPLGSGRWPDLRDAQARVAQSVPDTGLAVAIDVGEADNVHPEDKQSVAARLANWALASVYGRDLPCCSPVVRKIEHRGDTLWIHFDHTYGGLVFRGPHDKAFGIAGSDGQYAWADARIEGDALVLRSPQVPAPVSALYAWQINPPQVPLYNRAGLPAVPFRTDGRPLDDAKTRSASQNSSTRSGEPTGVLAE